MPGSRLPGGQAGMPAGKIGAPVSPGGGMMPTRNGPASGAPSGIAGGGAVDTLPNATAAGALSQTRVPGGESAIGARAAIPDGVPSLGPRPMPRMPETPVVRSPGPPSSPNRQSMRSTSRGRSRRWIAPRRPSRRVGSRARCPMPRHRVRRRRSPPPRRLSTTRRCRRLLARAGSACRPPPASRARSTGRVGSRPRPVAVRARRFRRRAPP